MSRPPVAAVRRALAGTMASAALLSMAGCGNPADLVTGGHPVRDYCTQLHQDRRAFADMIESSSPTALVTHLPMLRDLAHDAPPDIADDWQQFVTPIEGLRRALQHAGVRPSQFHGGKPPAGLGPAQQRAIATAADQISSRQTVEAASTIDQEARDVCKINLGM
ncbi:MAG: hypothetical protein ACRDPH_05685 [Marmoricola sp.]